MSRLQAIDRGVDADAVSPAHRGAAALLAATVVNLLFGTLYAFSVFVEPMEALLGATRAEMGFVFGLATVTLTVGMNFAPQLYGRLSPVTLALACGLTSGLGLVLAASASGFSQFAFGYGVLFGPGAGVLFIISQQAVNHAVVQRRGLANGYVVSLYPLGAMLGAPVFGWSIAVFGVRPTLAGLGVVVLAACAIAAACCGPRGSTCTILPRRRLRVTVMATGSGARSTCWRRCSSWPHRPVSRCRTRPPRSRMPTAAPRRSRWAPPRDELPPPQFPVP